MQTPGGRGQTGSPVAATAVAEWLLEEFDGTQSPAGRRRSLGYMDTECGLWRMATGMDDIFYYFSCAAHIFLFVSLSLLTD